MNEHEERKRIWRECLDFEGTRDPKAFYQAMSLEGNWCVNCGFFNRPEFKKFSEMTTVEKIMWDALKALPGFTAERERRKFRLSKSSIGVWCLVCEICTPMLPSDWK